jgi:hypothetical protein
MQLRLVLVVLVVHIPQDLALVRPAEVEMVETQCSHHSLL